MLSTPISVDEERFVRAFLKEYAASPGGDWLADVPVDKMSFRFCSVLSGDTNGLFSWLHPNTIFLAAPPQDLFSILWVTSHFRTIIHELRHAWQWRQNSLWYLLRCTIRRWTLEKDAKAVEEAALSFINGWEKRNGGKVSQMVKQKSTKHTG